MLYSMRELIGPCSNCGKDVYCRDGFLDGVYIDGELICRDCAEELEN
ncbi:MAG: hypothetical protein ACQEV0_02780 [Bacillota bacterium]